MAAYFGEVGNQVFGRISASCAREERRFLEAQVAKARRDVDDASRALREFQEKYKVLDLSEQSKAVISAMASIKGDLLTKQLQLSYLTSFSSRTESGVVQLQQQISILENKLEQLELARRTSGATSTTTPADPSAASLEPDIFPPALNVPELRFEFERLYREQKIQETVFFLLTQRYELARVDEARDTSTFQVLDFPILPTRHARPKRIKSAAVGLLAGAALGGTFILLPVWWRRRTSPAAQAGG
jgi:capsule polysaccharide export protein KpsE/RkpR